MEPKTGHGRKFVSGSKGSSQTNCAYRVVDLLKPIDSAPWSPDSIFYDPLADAEDQAHEDPARKDPPAQRGNPAYAEPRPALKGARQKAIEAVSRDLHKLAAKRTKKASISYE